MQDQGQFEDVRTDPTLAFLLDRRFSNPDSQYTSSDFDISPTAVPQFDRRMSLPFTFAPQAQQLLAGDASSVVSRFFPTFEQFQSMNRYESQNQHLAHHQQQQPKFPNMVPQLLPVLTFQFSSFHNGFVTNNATHAATTSPSQYLPFPPIATSVSKAPDIPPGQNQPTLLNQMKQSVAAAATEGIHSPASNLGKTAKFKPTEHQLLTLISVFEKNPFPSAALRNTLSEMLRVQPKQVRFWFQNRRATYKINGVHVLKPTRTKSGNVVAPVVVNGKDGETLDLASVSSENPYFYVAKGKRETVSEAL